MARSPLFDGILRALRIARACEVYRRSTHEVLERAAKAHARRRTTRREFLGAAGRLALASAVAPLAGIGEAFAAPKPRSSLRVGIVGAGMAGLACADVLRANGIEYTIYEASERVGGRVFSQTGPEGGFFDPRVPVYPGQIIERGGEFIDNLHKTLLGYCQRFGLALEDVTKEPGEVFYYFGGAHVPEEVVVEEFRALVDAMRDDLRTLAGGPSFFAPEADPAGLDRISLAEYLDTRGAGPNARAAIEAAYIAEYGREIAEQSSLNFLLFVHADRRSRFQPFGVFSDERYHVLAGNQAIPESLRRAIDPPGEGRIRYGKRLVAARKSATNDVVLFFADGTSAAHDAAVLAIPFTVLREVDTLGLGLSADKLRAIRDLGYGDNAKMMVGFGGRPWRNPTPFAPEGSNGTSYSLLPNHQTTWETNPTRATATSAVLTDYSGGRRGKRLDPRAVQTEATRFLEDLDKVFPGARAAARRDGKKILAHLEHWPSNPLVRGSYTCYLPGQFTTIAGLEGTPEGNVFFAGEHANSFYEWQGFMEGAALSGIDAAEAILQTVRR